jgi:hypothetical protein
MSGYFKPVLTKLASSIGASLIGFIQAGTGAVNRTVQSKMRDVIHVADFGALGGFTGVDDTLTIRAAIAAAPAGSRVVLGRGHTITDTITIDKPLTLVGGGKGHPTWVSSGSNVDDNDYTIRLTTSNKTAILLSANATNFPYYSPQVAAMGVTIRDMKILGPGNQASASLDSFGSGIATDLSLVGTNPSLHYREIVLDNVTVRFFNIGLNFQGICYINKFHDVVVSNVNIGYYSAAGGANDTGGQTRMYGCTFLFHAQWGIKWNYTGSTLSLFGCTVSEGNGGIWLNEEAGFYMSGCEIENNKTNNFLPNNASAAGLYINIAEANPNSDAVRYVVGNKFLSNTKDIWIEKTVAGWTSGINYPMVIDGNALMSSIAVQCDTGIDQSSMVFGASNSGNNNGRIADSQLVNFAGSDLRDFPYKTLKRRGSGYPVNYQGTPTGSVNLAVAVVPNNSTLYLEDIERYTFSTPSGNRSTAQLLVINQSNAELINLAGNGITPSAFWKNTTGATVNARIYTDNGYGTGNPMYISLSYRVG